jgi:hypothetical protein
MNPNDIQEAAGLPRSSRPATFAIFGRDLSLSVSVECEPLNGLSPQKVDEIKNVLRELCLSDNFTE